MAGRSASRNNWNANSPATRYDVSGKNREFYTFENAPGLGSYATGGTVIDGGDGYIYHIFTGSGTFTVDRPPAAIDSVDYLIVAGGGAVIPEPAGASGGGGAGGLLFGNVPVSNGSYPIVVGGGGPSVNNVPTTTGNQRNGSPSTAFGLIATGGGSGGNVAPGGDGRPGGSGGGGAFPGAIGGAGNVPATIPRQGYSGATPAGSASGGGGAGGNGIAGGPSTSQVGAGGSGRLDPNFPIAIVSQAIPAPLAPNFSTTLTNFGGFAAGGCGTDPTGVVPAPLTRTNPQNSGFGGQGGGGGANAGGSGIVCIRYRKTAAYQRATGGTVEPSTHPEHPGVWRHIFTGSGTFTVTDPSLQWIDYLAVGGGGGGGLGAPPPFNLGGGGGAGGYVSSIHTSTQTPVSVSEAYPWSPGFAIRVGKQYPVGAADYPIVIGAGGAASFSGSNTTVGNPGANQIIAYGGGYGGTAPQPGGPGGSGGGGAKIYPGTVAGGGGLASPPPLTQGSPGATTPSTPNSSQGAGGGGAGGPGVARGAGGPGWYSVLSPSSYGTPGPLTPTPQYRYFAGGGGGYDPPTGNASGGVGGGGPFDSNGTANTGGGGGGAGQTPRQGGSGIVIIQYPE